jgi:branched-chain amino acid transport system substrate-binding protein
VAAANRPYAFGYSLTTDKKTAQLVDKWLATAGKGVKNVVVILDAKDAISKFDGSVEYPQVLKQHGIQILDTISIQTGDIDFSAAVTRAKNRNPDAVVMTTLHSEGGNLMRELRKQGMRQPVLAGVGILDPRFLELAGPAADGVMLGSDFYADSPVPGVAKWVAEFRANNNNMTPTAPAAMMYESLDVVRSCIVSQKVSGRPAELQADRDKIQKCLGSLKNHPVPLTGQVTINENGEALRKPQILVVKDSRFTAVP